MRTPWSHRFVCLAVASIIMLLAPAQAATFKNPQLIPTSYDPLGIASADFNRDGIMDLVYVDGSSANALHVLLGNGDGTFSHGQDIALPQGSCWIASCVINLADVTGDGITDVVLAGSGPTTGQIVVLIGNGDGTFQPPVVSVVTNPHGYVPGLNNRMGIGDINGDGAADIVVGDIASGDLYVLLGDNKGHFSVAAAMPFYLGPTITYLYDLNGDGHLDIVVNNLMGAQTLVLLGNGDGTFKPAVSYTSSALLLADMDGDGHPDLVGEVYPGQVQILKGNPDGTFGPPTVVATVEASARLLATTDLNGDGLMDLIFLTPQGIGVVLGQGNLTYGSMTSCLAGSIAAEFNQDADLTSGDFYGGGHNDIAMGVEGGILVLRNNGDGTFVSGDWYDVGQTVGTVSVADFNGDKHPDIAVTVSATYPRLLLGDGAGRFTLAPDQNSSYGTQAPNGSMLSADFNGDGKYDLDLLGPSSSTYPYGQPMILFGNGDGTFAAPVTIPTGPALVADLTNNSRSDMVSQSGNSILTLLGQTNETFTQVTTPLIHPTSGVAAIGDLNHDGKPDLLVYEYPSMRVWLGNGDGTFTQSGLVSNATPQINAKSVFIADLDGDGNGDIIVVPQPAQTGLPLPLLIYYGNGDGTFQDAVSLPVSHGYTQLAIADVNRDNKPDLVLSDGAGIAVITNLGGRNFGPEEHFVAGQNISGLSVVDVNGDGFPDIVVANAVYGTTVAVLLNEPTANPLNGIPSNGKFSISPEPAQYSQPVTLSITMSAPSGPVPTGSVSFNVDGSFITTQPLVGGTTTYAFSGLLNTGTHTFVATYDGDKTYAPENFSVLHVVAPPVYPTQTALAAVPTVVYTSQTVSLTATVSSSVPVPNGVVTFYDGANTLGSRSMASYGSSVFLLDTNLLTAGVHSLTATYHGWQDPFNEQATYQPSTSTPVTVTVNASATSTALEASTTSLAAGTVVTFTADTSSGLGVPFGGTTFYDGSVPLGTSSLLADGSCTYSTASLAVGTHNITAAFNANATFAGSMSPTIVITVTSAASELVPTAITVGATGNGDQSVLVANVSAQNIVPSGRVVFLDNGTILGSALTDGSGSASLTVPAFAAGAHKLFASFAGSSQFAPSVSPVLLEQFPNGGIGFSLIVAMNSVQLSLLGSAIVPVTITPTMGFSEQVHLSCVDGVPGGYDCSFSPNFLYSGVSYLQIQPKRVPRHAGASLYPTAVCILSFVLVGAVRRRRVRYVIALIACLGLAIMTGCGNRSSNKSSQQEMVVLSIQASAGTANTTVIHSAQVLVDLAR